MTTASPRALSADAPPVDPPRGRGGLASPSGSVDRPASYEQATDRLRLKACAIGLALTVFAVPAGTGLDAMVYPEAWARFGVMRLACALLAGLILIGVLRRTLTPGVAKVLGLVWPMLPIVMIAAMIAQQDGAASPHYAGLNLVLLAACLLMPYTLREALVLCGMTVGVYVIACLVPLGGPRGPIPTRVLSSNLFFIAMSSLACVTAGYFWTRTRLESFRLQAKLDAQNLALDEQNEALALSNAKLAEADRLKTEFIANVSHELRTPLTLILAPVDKLLAENSDDGSSSSELDLIRRNALRLLELVEELLEVMRLDSARQTGRDAPRHAVDLATFVAGVARNMQPLAGKKSIAIEVRDPAEATKAGPLVEVNVAQLDRLLGNLLTNAVKFTEASGRIDVRVDADSENVTVAIADTGVGIAEADLPHIFDRFRQGDGSATRAYQGVGLGLALARDIAEAHGGTLTAESELGVGTTLTLRLPQRLQAAGAAIVVADPPPFEAKSFSTPATSGATIRAARAINDDTERPTDPRDRLLIVEDEPDMREFLVALLKHSYDVVAVANGDDGIEAARTHEPSVVLCDLMMPGTSGFGVIEALRDADWFEGRIILLTARSDEPTKVRGLRLGADDFLVKPFSTAELRARVATSVRGVELEQQLRDRATELNDALQALRQAESELVHGEKMKALGRLSAGVLHEANNPLTYAKAAADWMAEELARRDDVAVYGETLDDIRDGLRRIAAVTGDLRRFVHPDPLESQHVVPVQELFTTAHRLVSHAAKDFDVLLPVIPAELAVVGSSSHLVQVLVNLLLNAIDAVGNVANPHVAIECEACETSVRIAVEDNGSGVDEAMLDKLVKPFVTTKHSGDGNGLGLSICRTILERHDATLDLRNREIDGKRAGFVASFALPVGSIAAAATPV